MEALRDNKLIKFHPDTLNSVRKEFSLDDKGRMKTSIDLLEEWTKKQKHFIKKDFDRDYLERMLISAKGSLERTKERLDRTCTFRTLMPDFFEDCDIKEIAKDYVGKLECVPTPRLTADHVRYFVAQHLGNEFTSEMYDNSLKYVFMMLEYMRTFDYVSCYEIIFDYRFCKLMNLIAAVNLMNLKKMLNVAIEGYGFRVKGVHVILDSNLVDIALPLAKQVIPKKLSNRLHLHKNLDSLLEMVDKDVMPVEYGGNEKPASELFVEWVEELNSKQFREHWKEMSKAKTDESMRQTDIFNEQYMGMPGSFRILSVD